MSRKIPETITEEELMKVIKYAPNKQSGIAYAITFYEALRISELIKLKPENIDISRRTLYLKQAKGNKDRNIPISPKVTPMLRHIPITIGVRALQKSFKKACLQALNRDLYFHCLRHSGATHYLNVAKWSTRHVQQLLGHAKITTTEIYTHVNPSDLIAKMWETSNKANF